MGSDFAGLGGDGFGYRVEVTVIFLALFGCSGCIWFLSIFRGIRVCIRRGRGRCNFLFRYIRIVRGSRGSDICRGRLVCYISVVIYLVNGDYVGSFVIFGVGCKRGFFGSNSFKF